MMRKKPTYRKKAMKRKKSSKRMLLFAQLISGIISWKEFPVLNICLFPLISVRYVHTC